MFIPQPGTNGGDTTRHTYRPLRSVYGEQVYRCDWNYIYIILIIYIYWYILIRASWTGLVTQKSYLMSLIFFHLYLQYMLQESTFKNIKSQKCNKIRQSWTELTDLFILSTKRNSLKTSPNYVHLQMVFFQIYNYIYTCLQAQIKYWDVKRESTITPLMEKNLFLNFTGSTSDCYIIL